MFKGNEAITPGKPTEDDMPTITLDREHRQMTTQKKIRMATVYRLRAEALKELAEAEMAEERAERTHREAMARGEEASKLVYG